MFVTYIVCSVIFLTENVFVNKIDFLKIPTYSEKRKYKGFMEFSIVACSLHEQFNTHH